MQPGWVRSAGLSLGVAAVLTLTASCASQPTDAADSEADARAPFGLELLAGSLGGPGNADGTGGAAAFDLPTSVAVDGAGNVYVADARNDTIRKITPAGVVTTLAGVAGQIGSADGVGASARLGDPDGVAVDAAGNVYVADTFNCSIRKITPDGAVTTLAGRPGVFGSADGTGAAAQFNLPEGVAVGADGNIYVADTQNFSIRKITADGVVTTLAGSSGLAGSADGTGAAAQFANPTSVAVDGDGNVYVADADNDTIRKITPAGVVTTLAGSAGQIGDDDGTGAAARFNSPEGVAVDGAGNVYVADGFNGTIRKITPAGVVTTIAGTAGRDGSADGTGVVVRFSVVSGVAVDGTGTLYVADQFNETIRKIAPTGAVTTLAGTASVAGATDGRGSAARFFSPTGVAAASDGTVYVTDFDSIRRINAADNVTTLAGGTFGSADGRGAAAQFEGLVGAAVDRAGNVYVADEDNATIRKITTGGAVTTLAGAAGQRGSADGTGAAARFNFPAGVAVDGDGNVFVADLGNVIRKVTPAGVVTTLAGTAGMRGSVDGVGAAARFEVLTDLAIDGAGNLYAVDFGANVIRKIAPGGVVTTLAGAADTPGSADGTGAAARFHNPTGVAVDHAGNVFVTDTANHTLRKITPAGVVTTVAGTAGVAGIVLGPTPQLAFPNYLAIVGDSIVLTDNRAVLLLRHGAP
jgi:sugar lactone lactonase YvrE